MVINGQPPDNKQGQCDAKPRGNENIFLDLDLEMSSRAADWVGRTGIAPF